MALCSGTWLGALRWQIKSQTFLSHQRSTALDVSCPKLKGFPLSFPLLKARHFFFCLVGPGSCCLSSFHEAMPTNPIPALLQVTQQLSCMPCRASLLPAPAQGGAVLLRNQFSYQHLWKISHGMETLWTRRQWLHKGCDVCGFRLVCLGFFVRG